LAKGADFYVAFRLKRKNPIFAARSKKGRILLAKRRRELEEMGDKRGTTEAGKDVLNLGGKTTP
jgi:hypothetical protein